MTQIGIGHNDLFNAYVWLFPTKKTGSRPLKNVGVYEMHMWVSTERKSGARDL